MLTLLGGGITDGVGQVLGTGDKLLMSLFPASRDGGSRQTPRRPRVQMALNLSI